MVLAAKIMQSKDIVKGLNLSHADQVLQIFKLSFRKSRVLQIQSKDQIA